MVMMIFSTQSISTCHVSLSLFLSRVCNFVGKLLLSCLTASSFVLIFSPPPLLFLLPFFTCPFLLLGWQNEDSVSTLSYRLPCFHMTCVLCFSSSSLVFSFRVFFFLHVIFFLTGMRFWDFFLFCVTSLVWLHEFCCMTCLTKAVVVQCSWKRQSV